MGVASGSGEQEAGVASGSGWDLWVWLLGVVVRRYIPYREILEGANFRINGRKAFRIIFRILIFVCAHAGMPHPLVWQVHVYST